MRTNVHDGVACIFKLLQLRVEDDFKTQRKVVLLGSRAYLEQVPEKYKTKTPNDWDLAATWGWAYDWCQSTHAQWKRMSLTEYCDVTTKLPIQWVLHFSNDATTMEIDIVCSSDVSSAKLISNEKMHAVCTATLPVTNEKVAVVDLLVLERVYTSHIYHTHHWRKYIETLHTLRECLVESKRVTLDYFRAAEVRKVTNKIVNEWDDFVALRRQEADRRSGVPGAHISMKGLTNEEFLDEDKLQVDRYIEHDELHRRVMCGSVPMQDKIRPDLTKPMCDPVMYFALSEEDRLNDIREEAWTITEERYLLPGKEIDQQQAYDSAVQRICTTLTKGWFRADAVDNWPKIKTLNKDLIAIRDKILEEYHQRVKQDEDSKQQKAKSSRDEHIEETRESFCRHIYKNWNAFKEQVYEETDTKMIWCIKYHDYTDDYTPTIREMLEEDEDGEYRYAQRANFGDAYVCVRMLEVDRQDRSGDCGRKETTTFLVQMALLDNPNNFRHHSGPWHQDSIVFKMETCIDIDGSFGSSHRTLEVDTSCPNSYLAGALLDREIYACGDYIQLPTVNQLLYCFLAEKAAPYVFESRTGTRELNKWLGDYDCPYEPTGEQMQDWPMLLLAHCARKCNGELNDGSDSDGD